MHNSSLSLPRFVKVCLGEADEGKKFVDVEADAKDKPARTGHYAGEN